MRVGLERIGVIIKKYGYWCTRINYAMGCAGSLESFVMPGFERIDMVWVQGGERLAVFESGGVHLRIITLIPAGRRARNHSVFDFPRMEFKSRRKLGIMLGLSISDRRQ